MSLARYTAGAGTDFTTEYTSTAPTAPATGVTPFARKKVGKTFLSSRGIIGSPEELQAHIAFRHIGYTSAIWGATTASNIGTNSATGVGSFTARLNDTTNFLTQYRRVGIVSSGTAGSTANIRNASNSGNLLYRGDAANKGGFFFQIRFGISQTATGYIFWAGLQGSINQTPATATDNASNQVNIIGVGKDAGDTNFQFMFNDASGVATKVDTGITPSATTMYALRAYCKPNDTVVYLEIEDLSNNTLYPSTGAGYAASSNLPSSTTQLTWGMNISNNATAAVVAIEEADVYMETES